ASAGLQQISPKAARGVLFGHLLQLRALRCIGSHGHSGAGFRDDGVENGSHWILALKLDFEEGRYRQPGKRRWDFKSKSPVSIIRDKSVPQAAVLRCASWLVSRHCKHYRQRRRERK